MLVGVFSDSHDNVPQIKRAVARFRRRQVAAVLHAGDIVAPFSAMEIAKLDVPLHVVYGNNDGEKEGLKNILPTIADGPIEFELDGCRVAMAHDWSQMDAERRRRAKVLVAGHTHVPMVERIDDVLWVNPGECGAWVEGRSTIVVLDTDEMSAEIIELPLS